MLKHKITSRETKNKHVNNTNWVVERKEERWEELLILLFHQL